MNDGRRSPRARRRASSRPRRSRGPRSSRPRRCGQPVGLDRAADAGVEPRARFEDAERRLDRIEWRAGVHAATGSPRRASPVWEPARPGLPGAAVSDDAHTRGSRGARISARKAAGSVRPCSLTSPLLSRRRKTYPRCSGSRHHRGRTSRRCRRRRRIHGRRRRAPGPGRLSAALRRRIRIDVRALAAFRVALGVVLLVDLALRARNLTAFYTDAGVLPDRCSRSRPPSRDSRCTRSPVRRG